MAHENDAATAENIEEEEEGFEEEPSDDDDDEDEEFATPLEADRVYVLMKKDYRLSRNSRAKWYLKHLIPQKKPTGKDGAAGDRGDDFRVGRFESIDDMTR